MNGRFRRRGSAAGFARVAEDERASPEQEQYAGLLVAVRSLRREELPEARPEFTTGLRAELLAQVRAANAGAGRPTPTGSTVGRGRRVALALTTLAVFSGSIATAVASEHANPGDALYPVKRALEQARTTFTPDDSAQARLLLEQSATRLREVDALLGRADNATTRAQVRQALAAFRNSSDQGATMLLSGNGSGESAQVLMVRSFTARELTSLADLRLRAPASLAHVFVRTTRAVVALDRRAAAACSSCGGPPLRTTAAGAASGQSSLRTLLVLPARRAGAHHHHSPEPTHPRRRTSSGRHHDAAAPTAGGAPVEDPGGSQVHSGLPEPSPLPQPTLPAPGPTLEKTTRDLQHLPGKVVQDTKDKVDSTTGSLPGGTSLP